MKLLGGILLIVGSAIGAGMLALPIVMAPIGFFHSTFLLVGCWLLMTSGALLLLEINLWLPPNSNIISMAKTTLGKSGQAVSWVIYLLLLYSLLSAYIAGGSDFLMDLFHLAHITMLPWLNICLFTLLFGYIVFRGIQSVDYANRFLMSLKLIFFLALISLIIPHSQLSYLNSGHWHYMSTATTVAITSFGFAPLIPSLRSYFKEDIKQLKIAIIIGSFIPLVCYIAWELSIMGTIPTQGDNGLISMLNHPNSTSAFVTQLSSILHNKSITTITRFFTSICLLTSFLGVALCLTDFLADGLQLAQTKTNRLGISLITFLPPLLIVLIWPHVFIAALSYAGTYCVVLLILLPALMAWRGRYQLRLTGNYRVPGGQFLLASLIVIAVLIIADSLLTIFH
jgi:tyrosine-specific transport protein